MPNQLKDKVPGGLADNKPLGNYSKEQLIKGLQVEMEHTDDPALALEIATDHLEEDSSYYDHLKEMEDKHAGADSINLETGEGLGSYVENEILQFAPPELVEEIRQKYLAEGKSLDDLSEEDVIDLLDDILDMPITGSYTNMCKHSSSQLSSASWDRIARANKPKRNM